jgi:hypothetical protein
MIPPHVLRIVEKPYGLPVGEPVEPLGIVFTNVYLDGKELHLPINPEVRIVFGPDIVTVAWVPLIVDKVVVEREDAPKPPGIVVVSRYEEFAVCRQRTPDEDAAVRTAELRRYILDDIQRTVKLIARMTRLPKHFAP